MVLSQRAHPNQRTCLHIICIHLHVLSQGTALHVESTFSPPGCIHPEAEPRCKVSRGFHSSLTKLTTAEFLPSPQSLDLTSCAAINKPTVSFQPSNQGPSGPGVSCLSVTWGRSVPVVGRVSGADHLPLFMLVSTAPQAPAFLGDWLFSSDHPSCTSATRSVLQRGIHAMRELRVSLGHHGRLPGERVFWLDIF